MKSRFTTRTIVEAGMMIALTALLGRVILFRAPFGGKVTAGSMIPLLLIAMLRGISCGGKPTSCPDQLSIALTETLEKEKQQ